VSETEITPLAAWKLPLIVAAIAVAIVGGFYLGGAGLGLAVGALTAAVIVFMAARKPPLGTIVPPVAPDLRRHLLVVLQTPLEQAAAVEAVVDATQAGAVDVFEPEVLLLAPCRSSFLDRWTSDVGPARQRAQRSLVLATAVLAAAGIPASARAGDEDTVQAIEDTLRSFPATEVMLVDDTEDRGAAADRRISDMRSRLAVPLRRVSPQASRGPAAADPAVARARA
jgi:hypothetical protein